MKIGSIGYNYSHDASFEMDLPFGPGSRLFLLIKSSARFVIRKKEYIVKENSFIMFSPDTPCYYKALNQLYTDDWMYFDADEQDDAFFAQCQISKDEVVYLGNVDELSQIMHVMAYEHYSAEEYHEEIEEYYLKILFRKLGRIIKSQSCISSKEFVERNNMFSQIRMKIFTTPADIRDIAGLAQQTGMSRSGFQHLYKKMFGVSVKTDVINGRMDYAKRLLSTTNLTIREIAEICGYKNECSFMRKFKERCGKTPTEFRKKI